MNEKNILIDEYINISNKSFMIEDVKELINNLEGDNLEVNFEQKCNLNLTNEYEPVEGDDEQTDEDGQISGNKQLIGTNSTNSINTTPIQQRRRRKSSGRSKLNKNFQSSTNSTAICNNNNLNKNSLDLKNAVNKEDALQSSSTSLSSWVHLPEQNHQLIKNSKNLKNLNSSCDTISEEEHRAKKRNLRSIDDDIVSSSNDDLPTDKNFAFATDNNKLLENSAKLEKKLCCDSLSSSPTNNASYDSSSPIKSTSSKLISKSIVHQSINGNQMILNQNKENHLLKHFENSSKLAQQANKQSPKSAPNKIINNSNFLNHQKNYQSNQQCLNCLNNNYIDLEQQNIPWFYEGITREDADKFLTKFLNVDGVFLVRTSSKNPENYVLSFVHLRKVQHCHIRKMDVESTICFSIDGKMRFYDLKGLVEFYQLNLYYLPTKLKYFFIKNSQKCPNN